MIEMYLTCRPMSDIKVIAFHGPGVRNFVLQSAVLSIEVKSVFLLYSTINFQVLTMCQCDIAFSQSGYWLILVSCLNVNLICIVLYLKS